MAQPFDYGVNIPDPAQAFKQAYEMGTVITNQRLAQEKAQREAEQQKQIQESFARLRQPNATARDYANLSMLLPEAQAKSVRESFGMLSAERQLAALQQAGQVLSAFKSGNSDIAIRYLDQQIEGKRNSGDEAGAKFLETWRDVAKVDPKATEDYFGYTISQMPGGDKVITSAIALSGEGRAAAKAPAELREAVAKADKAESDAKIALANATNAPEIAAAETQLKKAQAETARIKALFTERMEIADLDAKAATLGLTRAQTNQVLAQIRKLGVETQKVVLELEASKTPNGTIPEEKRPDAEARFRKEYNDQTKPYQEVKAAYGRVLSSQDTAVGDLSLIFGYMKMLDPGSVVREGEFATAQNAAGVPDRIMNIYNKVATGQRLSPSQRDSFKGQANGLYSSALEGEKTVRTGLERISKGYGLNTNNIFYSATEQAPAGAPPAFVPPPSSTGMFAPTPAKTGGTPAAKQKNVTVNY
jgi:hypothetical protein